MNRSKRSRRSGSVGCRWAVVLGAVALAWLFGTSPGVLCQDDLVTEDFEDDAVDAFPGGWEDLADVVVPQEEVLSAVKTATGPDGEPTRVLEVRSLQGRSQGIYRPLASEQQVYRATVDVYMVSELPVAPGNVSIDFSFAIRGTTDPFSTWTGAGGCGSPTWWDVYSAWPINETVVSVAMSLGRWYRASVEVDTSSGSVSSRVTDLVTGFEVVSLANAFQEVIGRRFDAVCFASHHMGAAGQESITRLDNISYSDPSGGLFPEAALTVENPPEGCFLSGEIVRLDGSKSTTPEGSEIVAYKWDFGDGTTGEGPTASHVYDHCGRFEITLEVTNDRAGSSTAKESVCVVGPAADPSSLAPWTAGDMGQPALPGAAWPAGEGDPGCFSWCVGGYGIYGGRDECHLIRQAVEGDGMVSARVEDMAGGTTLGSAGVMFRDGLDEGAVGAALCLQSLAAGKFRCMLAYRLDAGKSRKNGGILEEVSLPAWLRLKRTGNSFAGELSSDGIMWTPVGAPIEIPGLGSAMVAGAMAFSRESPVTGPHEGLHGTICALEWTPSGPPGTAFRRGDSNCDGAEDLSDAVASLGYLFLGDEAPCCLRAADTNRDDEVGISDAIFLLNFLFLGGKAPAAPYGACGRDPEATLPCESYPPCR
jgi:hypothetical protein